MAESTPQSVYSVENLLQFTQQKGRVDTFFERKKEKDVDTLKH